MFGKLFGAAIGSRLVPDSTEWAADTPAFMRQSQGFFFQDELEIVTVGSRGLQAWLIKRQDGRDRNAMKRFWVALARSVMWERSQRGFPVRDDQDRPIIPECTDTGFIIERRERDDGSVTALVAYDIVGPVSGEIFERAVQKRIAAIDQLYLGQYRKTVTRGKYEDAGDFNFVPIFRLKIREEVIQEAPLRTNPFEPRSTQMGSAQFAWVDEMLASTAYRTDGDFRVDASIADFHAENWSETRDDYVPIATAGEGHRLVVGSPGTGKFTAAIAPILFMTQLASFVVFDVANGEAARLTAGWRSTKCEVVVLDPFGITGLASASLNPLSFLRSDDPDLLQAATRLADALFIAKGGTGNEDYFNDQARDVLRSLLLHVATSPDEEDRTLARVRAIIRRPFSDELLQSMEDNNVAGGVVADTAANLLHAEDSGAEKNTFYVVQTLRANTAFLDLPAVQRATATSTFDPAVLRARPVTLYVSLPEDQLETVSRWLRLIYTTIMERVRVAGGTRLHVLIDEFPALGYFPRVSKDMDTVRKYDINLHVFAQSLNQLRAIYGDAWENIPGAADYRQLMGTNDLFTADYFSRQLGKTTRRSDSTSQNRSSNGGSQGTNQGWVADDLLSPDEIVRLDPAEIILLARSGNPLRLVKVHWFNIPSFKQTANMPLQDRPG